MPYSLATAYNNAVNDRYCEPGYCLRQVRIWWGVASKYGSAITAWKYATTKHAGDRNPPKGACVFWSGGPGGYGHIAFSLGNGYIRSTDAGGRGRNATVPLSWVEKNWGLHYLGWTRDLNGVVLPVDGSAAPAPAPAPVKIPIIWSELSYGLRNGSVWHLQSRMMELGYSIPSGRTGYYGDQTKAAVAAFQRKQGWSGAGADGNIYPGGQTTTAKIFWNSNYSVVWR